VDVKQYENNYTQETVEAVLLTSENVLEVTTWCEGLDVVEYDPIDDTKQYAGINVPTQLGMVRASEGDYVIQGANGVFYTLKPGAFANAFKLNHIRNQSEEN